MTDRTRFRARARTGGATSYDADAQAYIDATGELFPDDLNTLVLGIKAAGLWDNHIGSIKKAIGVPSLAASMIDLRNTAFNGTAVNTPGHSATTGWTFTAASSQYIDGVWQGDSVNGKGSLNSIHVGARLKAIGTLFNMYFAFINDGRRLGFGAANNGLQRFNLNEEWQIQTADATAAGNYISSRTGATARAVYKNGSSIGSDTQASVGVPNIPLFIGARNNTGTPDGFFSGRISLVHAGAGLDAAQAAALNTLFDAYATAAGET